MNRLSKNIHLICSIPQNNNARNCIELLTHGKRFYGLALSSLILTAPVFGESRTGNELSYDQFVLSDKPIKCIYGYYAGKTGDHISGTAIFEDCIQRWQSVYAMISLAHIYENGMGVKKNLKYAAELLRRGAETDDAAGYSSLAKYHYGVVLIEGRGIEQNLEEGIVWLKRAEQEGVTEAGELLKRLSAPDQCGPEGGRC